MWCLRKIVCAMVGAYCVSLSCVDGGLSLRINTVSTDQSEQSVAPACPVSTKLYPKPLPEAPRVDPWKQYYDKGSGRWLWRIQRRDSLNDFFFDTRRCNTELWNFYEPCLNDWDKANDWDEASSFVSSYENYPSLYKNFRSSYKKRLKEIDRFRRDVEFKLFFQFDVEWYDALIVKSIGMLEKEEDDGHPEALILAVENASKECETYIHSARKHIKRNISFLEEMSRGKLFFLNQMWFEAESFGSDDLIYHKRKALIAHRFHLWCVRAEIKRDKSLLQASSWDDVVNSWRTFWEDRTVMHARWRMLQHFWSLSGGSTEQFLEYVQNFAPYDSLQAFLEDSTCVPCDADTQPNALRALLELSCHLRRQKWDPHGCANNLRDAMAWKKHEALLSEYVLTELKQGSRAYVEKMIRKTRPEYILNQGIGPKIFFENVVPNSQVDTFKKKLKHAAACDKQYIPLIDPFYVCDSSRCVARHILTYGMRPILV